MNDNSHTPLASLIHEVLDLHNLNPVIVDIGSSGYAQSDHQLIAAKSTIIGFEADGRGQDSHFAKGFRKVHLIDKAVVADDSTEQTDFFLTKRPGCSSILQPDLASLRDFAFYEFFLPERVQSVPATSLNRLFQEYNLNTLDWLKVDAQGADLQLIRSLKPELFDQLLVVEVEPGLINAYEGENLFPETHDFFVSQGFWLIDLDIQRYPRISALTKDKYEKKWQLTDLDKSFGKSPTACEARYVRTVQYLSERIVDPGKYALSFVFAISCGHLEYGVEILNLFEKHFSAKHQASLRLMEKTVLFLLEKRRQETKHRPLRTALRGLRKVTRELGL